MAAAAPKTLAELAALASIEVSDLKAFTAADFEELAKELAIPVAAKVKLRGLHNKLLDEGTGGSAGGWGGGGGAGGAARAGRL